MQSPPLEFSLDLAQPCTRSRACSGVAAPPSSPVVCGSGGIAHGLCAMLLQPLTLEQLRSRLLSALLDVEKLILDGEDL